MTTAVVALADGRADWPHRAREAWPFPTIRICCLCPEELNARHTAIADQSPSPLPPNPHDRRRVIDHTPSHVDAQRCGKREQRIRGSHPICREVVLQAHRNDNGADRSRGGGVLVEHLRPPTLNHVMRIFGPEFADVRQRRPDAWSLAHGRRRWQPSNTNRSGASRSRSRKKKKLLGKARRILWNRVEEKEGRPYSPAHRRPSDLRHPARVAPKDAQSAAFRRIRPRGPASANRPTECRWL